MIFHWSFILVIGAGLLAMWAQHKVKSTYNKYSQVGTRRGMTGAEVARLILRDSGIEFDASSSGATPAGACSIEAVPGELTDHYDPRSRTLRLSEGVYHGQSVAALGVAAHEVGHAIQHDKSYGPLVLRGLMYPAASIGSKLGTVLLTIGIILMFVASQIGVWVLYVGIAFFSMAVVFTLITLPVEFDASKRALRCLATGGYMQDDEVSSAKRVLDAAAMTYVAAAAVAVSQLLHYILIARSMSR